MKKTQYLASLTLYLATQSLAAGDLFLPCDKVLCTDYFKVETCHLAQCVFDLKTLHDNEKFFRIGCTLLPTDRQTGRDWLQAAANLDHTEAMFVLAQNYEQQGELHAAWMGYKKAANNHHLQAQIRLAEHFHYGQGTAVNLPMAIYWYSEAGNQGYLPGQLLLADWYFVGQICQQDFSQAAYWYHLAALQGDPHAAFHYGAMLSSGNGVAYDEKEAIKWLTIAANQDNLEAQSLLGRMLYKHREMVGALCWLKKAAAKGDVYSMTTLARIYRYGHGVSQDFRQAAFYLERAAASGHTQAQAMLGLYYNQGIGVPKNYRLAQKWYEQAALKGNALAQFNLSTLYFNGRGVEVDYIHAYAWASLAADSGLHSAAQARRLLSNQMTVTQVERAQCLASQLVK